MKYTSIVIGLVIFVSGCLNSSDKMTVIPLKMMDTTFTSKYEGRTILEKVNYYLMKGYRDNEANSDYLNAFVESHKDTGYRKYNDYYMIFYKESGETNIATIKKYIQAKGNFYYNEDDLIYQYGWINGHSIKRSKFKHGVIVEPKSNIIIKNIPIPADSVKN
jgi:hypothetical protein